MLSDEAVTPPIPLVKAVLDDSHLLFQFYHICIMFIFIVKTHICSVLKVLHLYHVVTHVFVILNF